MTAAATTNVVTSGADSGAGTLRQTLLDATPGDVITFATSLSGTNILLTSGQLELDKNLTVDASSLPDGIQIDGNANDRIFKIVQGKIVTFASLTITNGKTASDYGGGIYNAGNLTINQCIIAGNESDGVYSGGGIYNDGYNGAVLTLNQSTIKNNSAPYGGAIANIFGVVVINGSTLSSNAAGSLGGAIEHIGTLVLNQCTLAGNQAPNGGGAINSEGSLTVNQCTIVGNSGNFGGGIRFASSSEDDTNLLANSIIAGNAGNNGKDIIYFPNSMLIPLIVGGTNLIQNLRDLTHNQTNNIPAIYAAPQLAPLGNYGGPTQTMPPLPGSPAIDAGGDFATNNFASDQRGLLRLYGAHVDIGAVELQVQVVVATNPPVLAELTVLSNGAFGFSFTNLTGASFTVFASTNFSLSLNSWANLGPALETPPDSGQYQFIDPQTTNNTQRFYRVRSP